MWFKVDDKFPEHRKCRHVRRSDPAKRRDVAPIGLWALAGAWSDDGFVPLEVLQDWDDDAEELAGRLVAAGLWVECTQDDEPGYRFHDWTQMNPNASERGAEGNHLRWHVARGVVADGCAFCHPDDRPRIAPESGGDSGAISPPNRGRIGGRIAPMETGAKRAPGRASKASKPRANGHAATSSNTPSQIGFIGGDSGAISPPDRGRILPTRPDQTI